MIDQPPPTAGAKPVFQRALEWAYTSLVHQKKKGDRTYGQPLMTWDGRYYHVDLMQEIADAQVYATKGHLERLDLEAQVLRLRNQLAATRELTLPLCDLNTCGDCAICTINARTEEMLEADYALLATAAEARQRNGDSTPEGETVVARPKRAHVSPVKRWLPGGGARPVGDVIVGTLLSSESQRLPDDRGEDGRRDAGLRAAAAYGGAGVAPGEYRDATAGQECR